MCIRDSLLAAEELLASHGPGALTQRRIAKQAGVSPTALYTYAADLEEIRTELGDRFLGAIDTGLLLINDPETALATFLQHVQKLFTDNPGHAQLLALQRIAGPNALKLNTADVFPGCGGAQRRGCGRHHRCAHRVGLRACPHCRRQRCHPRFRPRSRTAGDVAIPPDGGDDRSGWPRP